MIIESVIETSGRCDCVLGADISGERLVEFIATLKPSSEIAKEIQLTGETEQLQESAGLLPSSTGRNVQKVFGFDAIQSQALTHISGVTPESSKTQKKQKKISAEINQEGRTQFQSDVSTSNGHDEFTFGELD